MYGLWTHKSIFSELITNCSKTLLKINKNFFFASYFFVSGKKHVHKLGKLLQKVLIVKLREVFSLQKLKTHKRLSETLLDKLGIQTAFKL